MNSFLPYADFIKSAKCLDYKRLGKQRVETWQIYNCLKKGEYIPCPDCVTLIDFKGYKLPQVCKCKGTRRIKTAWYNHPVVQMWKGYEQALLRYGMAICEEWKRRGFIDNMLDRFIANYNLMEDMGNPLWLGNNKFHASMRSNLLRKDNQYYAQFGWKEPDNLPYEWKV